MSEPGLYGRIGGEEGIRAITTDIFDNHVRNNKVSVRYQDSDHDRVIRVVTEFICAGTGGPQEYAGKNMLATHRGPGSLSPGGIRTVTRFTPFPDTCASALQSARETAPRLHSLSRISLIPVPGIELIVIAKNESLDSEETMTGSDDQS
jgi:truncated hemoglobin YjbI